jgi:hypothetical protein
MPFSVPQDLSKTQSSSLNPVSESNLVLPLPLFSIPLFSFFIVYFFIRFTTIRRPKRRFKIQTPPEVIQPMERPSKADPVFCKPTTNPPPHTTDVLIAKKGPDFSLEIEALQSRLDTLEQQMVSLLMSNKFNGDMRNKFHK